MTGHESIKKLSQQETEEKKEFTELTEDIEDAIKKAKDPVFMAGMIYKLAEERRKTNELMQKIEEKFDQIMFSMKTGSQKAPEAEESKFEILPEQDQLIVSFIEQNGSATATEVQRIMHYKGVNAASQRLNSLYKQGMLKKIQAGKKVAYLIPNKPRIPL